VLTPKHIAPAVAVVVLLAMGWTFLAFCIVAGYAAGAVARARRGDCPAPDPTDDTPRASVDLDKAIGAIERLARIGATTSRRARPKRR
jgi:hypothetical protein